MAGGVQDGQRVNAAVTNAAFVFKNGDDATAGKFGLNNSDTVSGSAITNSQREFNALWSFLGGVVNQVKTYLPVWTSNNFGTPTDTIRDRINAIDAGVAGSGSFIVLYGSTRQTGSSLTASSQIVPTVGKNCLVFIDGFGGNVTVTNAIPVKVSGMTIGQILRIIGTDDSSMVTFTKGVSLVLNGDCTLAKDKILDVQFMGTDGVDASWVEIART